MNKTQEAALHAAMKAHAVQVKFVYPRDGQTWVESPELGITWDGGSYTLAHSEQTFYGNPVEALCVYISQVAFFRRETRGQNDNEPRIFLRWLRGVYPVVSETQMEVLLWQYTLARTRNQELERILPRTIIQSLIDAVENL